MNKIRRSSQNRNAITFLADLWVLDRFGRFLPAAVQSAGDPYFTHCHIPAPEILFSTSLGHLQIAAQIVDRLFFLVQGEQIRTELYLGQMFMWNIKHNIFRYFESAGYPAQVHFSFFEKIYTHFFMFSETVVGFERPERSSSRAVRPRSNTP